jgi:hypothetical protein
MGWEIVNTVMGISQGRRARRRVAAVFAAVGALIFSSGLVMITSPAANASENIAICHANNNPGGKPYVFQSPSYESALAAGHFDHWETSGMTWGQDSWWNGEFYEEGSARRDFVSSFWHDGEFHEYDGPGITEEFCNARATGVRVIDPVVTFSPATCTTAATMTKTPAEGVAWTESGSLAIGDTKVVDAAPARGYEFEDGATTHWTYSPTRPATCTLQVPAAPEPAGLSCTTDASLTVDQDSEFLDWEITHTNGDAVTGSGPYGPGEYTVTVSTREGRTFVGGSTQQSWNIDVPTKSEAANCVEIPALPAATDATCTTPGSFELPAGDSQFSWSIDPAYDGPGTYTVTVTTLSGQFTGGGTTHSYPPFAVEEQLTGGDCPGGLDPTEDTLVSPAYPTANDATCTRDGVLTVPAQPDGVLMTQTGSAPGGVTFTFAPAEDHAFPEGTDTEVTVTVPAKLTGDACLLGDGTTRPKPRDEGPDKKPVVLGSQVAVPTAVAAGLSGGGRPTTAPSIGSPRLAQALVAGGLLMLVAAGSTGLGRRTRGAHES